MSDSSDNSTKVNGIAVNLVPEKKRTIVNIPMDAHEAELLIRLTTGYLTELSTFVAKIAGSNIQALVALKGKLEVGKTLHNNCLTGIREAVEREKAEREAAIEVNEEFKAEMEKLKDNPQ